jgi:hypothetical protein
MDEKFRQLIELGAGEFEHVDGSLIAHLEGTMCLLKAWNSSKLLQDAGLYHAAYGTSAFEQNLFELSQRQDVAAIIGSEAECIVYHYCACDRDTFFAQFGTVEKPVFYDRITAQTSALSKELLQQLCELTAANETEIAINNPEFVNQHGAGLVDLFRRMQDFLSPAAQRKIQHVFAPSE